MTNPNPEHVSHEHLSHRHLSEEELVLLYYREPGVSPERQKHARECAECSAAFNSLARTLDLCGEWPVPDPDAGFEKSVWARLVPEIGIPTRKPYSRMNGMWPRWVMAAGLAAALCVAFFAGRASRKPEPAMVSGLSEQARARILAISVADHLDRAEMLLTGLSNAGLSNTGDSESPALRIDRARAQDLVEEGRLIRSRLDSEGQTATLTLLDEVERFMLEVANAPDLTSVGEIRRLQDRARSESLLFKVRIIESNLRSRDTQGQKL